jgi:1,4-alpha-glucan branching enzyme
MNVFRVWAPQATQVDIQIGDGRSALAAEAHGWWSLAVPSAGPETE